MEIKDLKILQDGIKSSNNNVNRFDMVTKMLIVKYFGDYNISDFIYAGEKNSIVIMIDKNGKGQLSESEVKQIEKDLSCKLDFVMIEPSIQDMINYIFEF